MYKSNQIRDFIDRCDSYFVVSIRVLDYEILYRTSLVRIGIMRWKYDVAKMKDEHIKCNLEMAYDW